MTLGRRIGRLEAGLGFGKAPDACWVYTAGVSFVHLHASGEELSLAEYDRRWPGHPPLKCYTDARMVDVLGADWSDAPAPRSSADA